MMTDEEDQIYDTKETRYQEVTRVGDTVLPSIYLNNNKGFVKQ
jgi:hypothetical protein